MAGRYAGGDYKPISKEADAMSDDIHKGHRERVKARYLKHGLDNFDDHIALELLLYYSIPRQDVNRLSHELINKFGSLYGVFDASVEALMSVNGVKESTALLIKLMRDINRRYLISKVSTQSEISLRETSQAGEFFSAYFYEENEEKVYIATLDEQLKLIKCHKLFEGNINTIAISIRKIVETALADRAYAVIMSHNHPRGTALPSYEDREATARVVKALRAVEIRFADHIIVGGGTYYSMNDYGMLNNIV